jgi:hypothetical protein
MVTAMIRRSMAVMKGIEFQIMILSLARHVPSIPMSLSELFGVKVSALFGVLEPGGAARPGLADARPFAGWTLKMSGRRSRS